MRVLVTGSRSFTNSNLVEEVLGGIYQLHNVGWWVAQGQPFHICHGEAKGADSLANMWCHGSPLHGEHLYPPQAIDYFDRWAPRSCMAPVVEHRYPADWVGPCDPSFCQPGHRRWNGKREYCPAAGPRRNRKMLEEFKPTRVVAFVDKPIKESRGTYDMVGLAKRAGIEFSIHGDEGSLEAVAGDD